MIYHHSLHREFFPQLPFYLLTYRLLIYVVDLNYVMLLFDVGLGWVRSDYMGHGLGWVAENGPTAMSELKMFDWSPLCGQPTHLPQ